MDWTPPIVKTSTVTSQGIDELWEAIEEHRKHQESSGVLQEKRRRRILEEVKSMVAFHLRDRAASALELDPALAEQVSSRGIDPYRAAEILVERVMPLESRAGRVSGETDG